ncbi:hypothetical protein C7C46_23650 [Streptomyces tateyamensis]|uniref:Uncharacterized protein n=1 Tax=Streptomyces tateyamensis TaxID=565073 RepID=A0A2V4NX11_9ACTN|nr:hypothetical protein [Streptomyces tateyamensis]PYC75790.1 hypothetical protein C7C46_23650 [Streptomyces tateyamensis]
MVPVLHFLAEAVADPSGPQAARLAHAARYTGSALSGLANAVGAVRKLRHRAAPEQPTVPCCCRSCPAHREAGTE